MRKKKYSKRLRHQIYLDAYRVFMLDVGYVALCAVISDLGYDSKLLPELQEYRDEEFAPFFWRPDDRESRLNALEQMIDKTKDYDNFIVYKVLIWIATIIWFGFIGLVIYNTFF